MHGFLRIFIFIFSILTSTVFSLILYLILADVIPKKTAMPVVSTDVYADISGAVDSPGVYKLKEGSRLSDLISEAGGFSKDADILLTTKQLNLATLISDSAKFYVPYLWDDSKSVLAYANLPVIEPEAAASTVPTESSAALSTGKVNINSASKEQLLDLPGIGEVYAEKLMAGRPYTDKTDLVAKSKISASIINKFISDITFE